jgi:hypothetical protein
MQFVSRLVDGAIQGAVDSLVAVLRVVTRALPDFSHSLSADGAGPRPEVDPTQPITGGALAERLGLIVVEGDAAADLRAVAMGTHGLVLGGQRAGRSVELVHRHRVAFGVEGVQVADDQHITLRTLGPIPEFECGSKTTRPRTSLPASSLVGARDELWLRAHDSDGLRDAWPVLVELLQLPMIHVWGGGDRLILSAQPGADTALYYGAHLLDVLDRTAEVLERGTTDGATIPMTALVPTPPSQDRSWATSLLGGTIASEAPAPPNELGPARVTYARSLVWVSPSDIGGVLLGLGYLALTTIGAVQMGQPRVWLMGALVAGGIVTVSTIIGWTERLERIVVRRDGFEWHRVLRRTVKVPFADVSAHHRAMRHRKGRYSSSRYAELVIERARGGPLTMSTAPGMLELAELLDAKHDERRARRA